MKFRDLNINDVFWFCSEFTMPLSGAKVGPWKKVSSRKYVHHYDGMECRVGSINTEVVTESTVKYWSV